MAEAQRQEPNWQPLSMLATLTSHIESGIAMVRDQKATLEQGLAQPYRLDDATVTRAKKAFTQTAADNELFAEQGRRWAAEPGLAPAVRRRVEHYQSLVTEMTTETTAVLAIVDQLAAVTIEALMAKSDLEVGIEALARQGEGR
ncbi:hypothetical protein [Nonomuraea typhae]|uniref:hypothetical protein n=1 Tax=Nonomuraea typhae TaxID=2603600 RepID=UPI0012F8D0CD|nr:hypothetical protein [Nonomuraea typhae]